MNIENKFPGKDVSEEDIKSKFPLVAKKFPGHKSKFEIPMLNLVVKKSQYLRPNMIESHELIINIAENIKKAGADFIRGGAFKPLTFPYRSDKYNETREKGIEWIKMQVKVGIPVITEVMEEKYIELIAENADILQIGSRNMQNYPFLTACAKTGKPLC